MPETSTSTPPPKADTLGLAQMNLFSLFQHFSQGTDNPCFAVTLGDGAQWESAPGRPPQFTIHIHDPNVLPRILAASDDLALADAFVHDQLDIDGDLEAAYGLADFILSKTAGSNHLNAAWPVPAVVPHGDASPAPLTGSIHSKSRDRQAISYHYDLSNEFFALWLDPRMVYSCAYFHSPEQTLEQAQRNKLDYICRKLRLKEGERFLDVGCGWGALVIHAAKHFGVRARGITLSQRQRDLARQRVAEAGLDRQCQIDLCDYRDLGPTPAYDKIASVGMVEHVGQAQLNHYFSCLSQALQPGGALLNHGIARPSSEPAPTGPNFVDTYVFPDGELPAISTVLHSAVLAGFEPRDLESLREHYALTLRHWLRGLEEQHTLARRLVGEETYRIWRLFMSMSAHAFAVGKLNLYQALLIKPRDGQAGLPLTRRDWYVARPAPK